MKQKIIRVGPHSLGVVVPSEFIHLLGIKKGEMVDVEVNPENGKIVYRFKGNLQLHLPEAKQNSAKSRL